MYSLGTGKLPSCDQIVSTFLRDSDFHRIVWFDILEELVLPEQGLGGDGYDSDSDTDEKIGQCATVYGV